MATDREPMQHLFGDIAAAGLDSIDTEVAFLDAEGRILAANRAWRRFASENDADDPDAYVGRSYLGAIDVSAGAEAAVAGQAVKDVLGGVAEMRTVEYPCFHADGTRRWFLMRVHRFQGDGPVKVVVVHDDITMRKIAEEAQGELRNQAIRADRAEQGERSWTAVLNLLAHQINTPLTPILLALPVLEREAEGGAVDAVRKVRKNTARIQEVAQIAAEILRMRNKALALVPQDWSKTISGLAKEVAEELKIPGVVYQEGSAGRVEMEAGAMRSVLDALLQNAAFYGPKGGTIEVRTGRDGSGMYLEVEDEGPGVSEKERARIESVFQHGLASIEGQENSGLGLLLCAVIVHRHGGTLEVIDGAKGFCVRVQLPVLDG